MTWRISKCVLLILAFASYVHPGWNDTPTGLDLKKLPRFPLKKIHSGLLRNGQRLRVEDFSLQLRDPEIVLRGTGRTGRTWRADLYYASVQDIYRGDLDGNGTQDYVFVGSSPFSNGRLAGAVQITVFLMDADGIPYPSQFHAYDDPEGGLERILDLNHDGQAELITSYYDEVAWDSRVGPFSSGHWTHRLYQTRGLKWVEFDGSIAGLQFPLVHRWTYYQKNSPSERWPITSADQSKPIADRDGTIATVLSEPIAAVRLKPRGDCDQIEPGIVVYDTPRSRCISFFIMRSDSFTNLLRKIKAEGAAVHLEGIEKYSRHDCSAQILWARRSN